MKILHTSDLHIGKRIYEYSLISEQEFILNQIVAIAEREQPHAIILAGDIYDKSIPSAEAVALFDWFLTQLSQLGKAIFIISGNHDSAERVAFASNIMRSSNIFLSPVYNGDIKPITLYDGCTYVDIYMIPFVKPSTVQYYADEKVNIKSYNDAMQYIVKSLDIDTTHRNVAIVHQYITNAQRSESEDVVIGGLDNIDTTHFQPFDYVALGHLHNPQSCGEEWIRYSGSPLTYSFSEVGYSKSVTIVNIDGIQIPQINTIALHPLHPWYDLRGTYDQLTSRDYYHGTDLQEAFVRITLTDEDDIPDSMYKLRTIYHHLLELRYDNLRTRTGYVEIESEDCQNLAPIEIFNQLFEKQNGQVLSDEQRVYMESIIDRTFNP